MHKAGAPRPRGMQRGAGGAGRAGGRGAEGGELEGLSGEDAAGRGGEGTEAGSAGGATRGTRRDITAERGTGRRAEEAGGGAEGRARRGGPRHCRGPGPAPSPTSPRRHLLPPPPLPSRSPPLPPPPEVLLQIITCPLPLPPHLRGSCAAAGAPGRGGERCRPPGVGGASPGSSLCPGRRGHRSGNGPARCELGRGAGASLECGAGRNFPRTSSASPHASPSPRRAGAVPGPGCPLGGPGSAARGCRPQVHLARAWGRPHPGSGVTPPPHRAPADPSAGARE